MTLQEVKAEQRLLEDQVNLAVRQFQKRCGLDDWQITVNWGVVKITTSVGGSVSGSAQDVYTATVIVKQ